MTETEIQRALDVALMTLRSGRTQLERRAAFTEMQRLKALEAEDRERVAERERTLGLIL